MEFLLEFEKPIATLEKKLLDLKESEKNDGVDFKSEIKTLEKKRLSLIDEIFSKLTTWQRVQLSRHPNRPYLQDYLNVLFPDFMELHGDRAFGDDGALIGGTATFKLSSAANSGINVMVVGHQKGRSTKQKVERNFGMARPEGYRKAIRLFELAERFRMPVITLIDTPGAYPGMDAEERGQSQAIAESIRTLFSLTVPTCAIVIGEGGSGGALAIGVANRVLMQEYSIYSVISPESCASILWSDSTLAEKAADRLKLTPHDLEKMKVVDAIIPEPPGGAHRDFALAAELLKKSLIKEFGAELKKDFLSPTSPASLANREDRYKKFRNMTDFAVEPMLKNGPIQKNG